MTDQRIPSQWQLQETGEGQEQWMLDADEQRLPNHMQLQEKQAQQAQYATQYAPNEPAWRPIDYRAMQQAAQERPRGRGGLAFGALLLVALLAVGGYFAWDYMGQPDLLGMLGLGGTEDPAAVAAETPVGETPAGTVAVTEAATPAPVAVVPTETPTPEPSPTPYLVSVTQVTVNSLYGVNARSAALSTGTLIRTLDNGTTYYVASGPITGAEGDSWYEIALPEATRAYVIAEFVQVSTSMLPYERAVSELQAIGLPAPPPPVTASAAVTVTTPLTAGVAATTTAPVSVTAVATTGIAAAGTPTVTVPAVVAPSNVITVSAAISAPASLNLRRAPELDETNVITQVADQTFVTVIGRSADGLWVQVQLPTGTRGWVAEAFVNSAGSLEVIPLGTTQPLTPTAALLPAVTPALLPASPLTLTAPVVVSAPVTVSAPVLAPAAPVTPTVPITPTLPADVTGYSFKVSSLFGVNLRNEPSSASPGLDQLAWNTAGVALGKSADNIWVNVQLADGRTGWVAASAITLTPPQ